MKKAILLVVVFIIVFTTMVMIGSPQKYDKKSTNNVTTVKEVFPSNATTTKRPITPYPVNESIRHPDDPGPKIIRIKTFKYNNTANRKNWTTFTLDTSKVEQIIYREINQIRTGNISKEEAHITHETSIASSHFLATQGVYNVRRNLSLHRWEYSAWLSSAARAKSQDLAQYDYFAHHRNETVRNYKGYWHTKKMKRGCRYNRIEENIAVTFADYHSTNQTAAEQLLTTWMASHPHRKSILRKNDAYIGIGVWVDEAEEDGERDILATLLICYRDSKNITNIPSEYETPSEWSRELPDTYTNPELKHFVNKTESD